jgi:hypothetical protein
MGENGNPPLTVQFNRRLGLEFHGAAITSDAGLLAARELDETLGLSSLGATVLREGRKGRNMQHRLVPLLRQAVYSRLAGYEDTNDAQRLAQDPALRVVVGWRDGNRPAASTNTMSRFETETLTTPENLDGLSKLNATWVSRAMARTSYRRVILDLDSSERPVHGEQEEASYNGHFGSTCYHPVFLFNQFGDCEGALLHPGNVHSADRWREVLEPSVQRYRAQGIRVLFRGDAAFAKPELYSTWRQMGWATPSGCPPMRCWSGISVTCSSGRKGSCRRGPWYATTSSPIRQGAGTALDEWWPKWSGTGGSCCPAGASL